MDLFEELRSLIEVLDESQVEYAICGAVALAIHGVPRATRDIDLLARATDLDRFRGALRTRGFTVEALPMRFHSTGVEIVRFTRLGDPPLMVDLLVVDGPLAEVWATRERVDIEGNTLVVVSRAGLITLKLLSARPQDLADIAKLEEQGGD